MSNLRPIRLIFETLKHFPFRAAFALAGTLASNAFVGMAVLVPPVLAPLAALELGSAPSETGIFMAIISATGSAAALSSGILLRRIGAQRVAQLSLVFCSLGLALLSLGEFWLVVPAGISLGVGYGSIAPASSQILIQVSPAAHRSLIFSINQTGVPLGGVLAGILVPLLVFSLGWRACAFAIGLAGIAVAVVIGILQHHEEEDISDDRNESRHILAGIRVVLSLPGLRSMILPSISFSVIQICLGTFLVNFLTLNVGFELAGAGVVLAFAQGSGIGGRILWGWVADHLLSSRKLLALLGVLMAVATILVGRVTPGWPHAAVIAVALIQGATAIGWNGVYLAEVARLAPRGQAGSITGGAIAVTLLGTIFGPPFFTLILNLSGSYLIAFNIIAAFALISGLSCLWPLDRPTLRV